MKFQSKRMNGTKKPICIKVAGAVIVEGERYAMIRGKQAVIPGTNGRLIFPTGIIRGGERAVDCAMRSAKRQTGLTIETDGNVLGGNRIKSGAEEGEYIVRAGNLEIRIQLFEAWIAGGDIKKSCESLGVELLTYQEIIQKEKEGELANLFIISALKNHNYLIWKRIDFKNRYKALS